MTWNVSDTVNDVHYSPTIYYIISLDLTGAFWATNLRANVVTHGQTCPCRRCFSNSWSKSSQPHMSPILWGSKPCWNRVEVRLIQRLDWRDYGSAESAGVIVGSGRSGALGWSSSKMLTSSRWQTCAPRRGTGEREASPPPNLHSTYILEALSSAAIAEEQYPAMKIALWAQRLARQSFFFLHIFKRLLPFGP